MTRSSEAQRTDNSLHAAEPSRPNGSGASAIFAAGVGCFAVAMLALAGDKSAAIKSAMIFYKPTGPLSGVTTTAVAVWLVCWFVLDLRWRRRDVDLRRISVISVGLLLLSVLLTFPPIADLL